MRGLVSLGRGCHPLTRREPCSPQKQLHISRQRGKRFARKLVGAGGGAGAVAACGGVVPAAGRVESAIPAGDDVEPGSQNISYTQVDSVDTPGKSAPLQEPQPFSPWVTTALHIIFGLLTLLVTLVTLCSLMRIQAGIREPTIVGEAIEVYRRSIALAPGFIWVTILQLLAPALGLFMFQMASTYVPNSIGVWAYIGLVLMIMLGAIVYAWLYFAQYALISDGKH